MRLVVGLKPVSDTLDKPDLAEPGLRAGVWHALRCAGAWAGHGLRWLLRLELGLGGLG